MYFGGSGYLEQPVSDFEGLFTDTLKYVPEKVYNLEDNPEVYPEGIPVMKVVTPVIKRSIGPGNEPLLIKFDPPTETTVYHHIPDNVDVIETGTNVQKTPIEQFLSLLPISGLALFAFAL